MTDTYRDGAGSGPVRDAIALAFRPDIEGMRALAVLLVIAAHAKVPGLQGGFIGVDIFFVLSGYLITGLLCKEVEVSGRIKLTRFYARRLQRLMPALLLMVVLTGVASALLLAPFEQATQAMAGISAIAWLSNFYFAFAQIDYFGASAESNAFLHTWSLGVEEQFYLAWPLLVLFCLGLLGRKRRDPDWAQLRQGLLATLAISLAVSLIFTTQAPALAFYMTPSRAWQFALGAAVLLLAERPTSAAAAGDPPPSLAKAPWNQLALCGLGLIAIAAIWLDKSAPYPGWRAALPSLGTALVLAAGRHAPSNPCTRVLSLPPLVGIGRLSYSLYLWHWPVLVLGATIVGQSPLARLAMVAVGVALAWLSYHLVETPTRHLQQLRRQPAATIAGGVLLIAAGVGIGNWWHAKLPDWSTDPELTRFVEAQRDAPIIYAHGCDEWFHSSRVRACYFGTDDASRTAVLLGDSIGAQWFSVVQGHFNSPDWRVLVLTKSACPMVDLPIFYQRIGRRYTECEQWRQGALQYLEEIQPEVVILGSSHSYAYSADEWNDGSRRIFEQLRATAGEVYLLLPVPTLGFDAPACEARQAWRRRRFPTLPETCSSEPAGGALPIARASLLEAAHATGVTPIDLTDAVCPDGTCNGQQEGAVAYRDSQHLTDQFVRTLQARFDAALAPGTKSDGAHNRTLKN